MKNDKKNKNVSVRVALIENDLTAMEFCDATGRNRSCFSSALGYELAEEEQQKLVREIREVRNAKDSRTDA